MRHGHPITFCQGKSSHCIYISLSCVLPELQATNSPRYSKLEASGDLRNIIGNTDLDATRPLLDEDIQSAIESLNASTAAVGKQAEALMSQFHCFGKFFHLEDDRWASSSDLACLQKKHAVGLQNVSAKVTIIVVVLNLMAHF